MSVNETLNRLTREFERSALEFRIDTEGEINDRKFINIEDPITLALSSDFQRYEGDELELRDEFAGIGLTYEAVVRDMTHGYAKAACNFNSHNNWASVFHRFNGRDLDGENVDKMTRTLEDLDYKINV